MPEGPFRAPERETVPPTRTTETPGYAGEVVMAFFHRAVRRSFRYLTDGRRVNVKAVVVLTGAAALLAVGTYLVHGFQVRRNAQALAEHADRVEQQNQPEKAVEYLEQYLGLRHDDADVRARYGLLLARLAQIDRARANAFFALERAL